MTPLPEKPTGAPRSGSTPAPGWETVAVHYTVRVPADVVQHLADKVASERDYADDESRAEYLDDALCQWVKDRLPGVLTDHATGGPDVEI